MAVASFPAHFPVSQATSSSSHMAWQVHQPSLLCSLFLRPLSSSSHMAWERGYKSTTLTAVASFSRHFLTPPTWPGNEATNPPLTAVASFSGHFLTPPTWPGNEATNPPLTAVASFSRHFLTPPTWPGNEATNPPLTAVASFSGHFLAPPTWPGNEAKKLKAARLEWTANLDSKCRKSIIMA